MARKKARLSLGDVVRAGEWPFPLTDLPEGPLHLVFEKVDVKDILTSLPQVSKACASAVEAVCERRARSAKLRLPHRPRGAHTATAYPYLRLLRSRACVACSNAGEFHLRLSGTSRSNVSRGLLCPRCSRNSDVRDALVLKGIYVDLVGISGKKLMSAKDIERQDARCSGRWRPRPT